MNWWKRYWKKKTPEYRQKMTLASRARLKKSPVIIPFSKREVVNRDGNNCYLCGKVLTERQVTIDHVIPLSQGGFHCLSNAKVCCSKCNRAKSDKSLSEYLESRDGK